VAKFLRAFFVAPVIISCMKMLKRILNTMTLSQHLPEVFCDFAARFIFIFNLQITWQAKIYEPLSIRESP
jgi:hypothetical protein